MYRLLACMAIVVLLGGCTANPGPASLRPDPGLRTITDPNDYSYLKSGRPAAHVHDYWGGEASRVVFEGPFSWWGGTSHSISTNSFVRLPPPEIVMPGTGWVNLTVHWQNRYPIPVTVGFLVRTADANSTSVETPNGKTVSIESRDAWNDIAHAQVSAWSFLPRVTSSLPAWTANVTGTLKIEIARKPGPIAPSPPHPDAWGPLTNLTLFEQKGKLFELVGAGSTLRRGEQPTTAPRLKPVAPETTHLRIQFHYNSSTPADLHYKPKMNYWGADGKSAAKPLDPHVMKRQNRNGLFEWNLRIEPLQWDSPYATTSVWSVRILWGETAPGVQGGAGNTYMDGDYSLRIEAFRRP